MKLNTNSNVYTIVYATILVIIVACLLAVVSLSLKPLQDANVALDTKKQILNSLNLRNLDNATAEKTYSEVITPVTCDQCGLQWFEANLNGEKKYVLPVRGAGLWGPIWGYVALDEDKATIYGVFFNHEGETPGLGGEIKELKFQRQFEHKLIFGATGNGIAIEKEGNGGDVDCVSGATITSKGVETMLHTGLEAYKAAGWFNNNAQAESTEAEGEERETLNVTEE